jgi:hypothetical protein
MEKSEWRILVERYATRAREFSDAVALLGQANLPPAECRELLDAISVRHESCMAASDEVEQHIQKKTAAADKA